MNAESLFYVTMIPNGTNALTWHFHSVQLESDVPGSFVLHKIKKPDKYEMQKLLDMLPYTVIHDHEPFDLVGSKCSHY